jgi:hypothetical protein
MKTQPTSIRLPKVTVEQFRALREKLGLPGVSAVIVMAVDRLYQQECKDGGQDER